MGDYAREIRWLIVGVAVLFACLLQPAPAWCAEVVAQKSVSYVEDSAGRKSLGGASLTGGVATLTVAKFTYGAHTITATYSGDAKNNAGVSNAIVVAVARPNPADDPGVRQMIGAQVSAAARAARTQMSNVQSRFKQLHDESDACPDDDRRANAARDYCIVLNGRAQIGGA